MDPNVSHFGRDTPGDFIPEKSAIEACIRASFVAVVALGVRAGTSGVLEV